MTAGELLLACALDAWIGDPASWPHPVRAMGRGIVWCERLARSRGRTPRCLRGAGVVLAFGLPLASYVAASLLIGIAGHVHEWAGEVVGIALAATTLAWRDLVDHVGLIRRALEDGSLPAARQAVARVVGRDTEALSETEVVRATVETIAESASDGIVAPLFYLTLGGAPLALAYKAVNTLDSMIGHKEEPYRDFGWASARLDDLANWIPARLTAWLLVVAAWPLYGLPSAVESWRIWSRDGHQHPSPNSGRPEAAMAGALGVQLGGVSVYDGVPVERPCLGEGREALAPRHIGRALRLMTVASLIGMVLSMAALTLWK